MPAMQQNDITERERFPLLDERGRRMLDFFRQHPHAPNFNYHCGEKLSAGGLRRVQDFADELRQPPAWSAGQTPLWLCEYVRRCWSDVPYYRNRDNTLRGEGRAEPASDEIPLAAIPFTDRHDFRRQPWSFVPD